MIFDAEIRGLAQQVVDSARARNLCLTTAESCTGGLVCAALTDVAGTSAILGSAVVTYSNAAKQQLLGVPAQTLEAHGAVSPETACAMAEGALAFSGADIAVAVSGIAGPDGGSPEKPVGMVVFARAMKNGQQTISETKYFGDIGRDRVRHQAVCVALRLLLP